MSVIIFFLPRRQHENIIRANMASEKWLSNDGCSQFSSSCSSCSYSCSPLLFLFLLMYQYASSSYHNHQQHHQQHQQYYLNQHKLHNAPPPSNSIIIKNHLNTNDSMSLSQLPLIFKFISGSCVRLTNWVTCPPPTPCL